MSDRLISDLWPSFQPLATQFLTVCNKQFITRIIQTWRDPAYQSKLKASGVSALSGQESFHCTMLNGKPASQAFDFGIFEDDGTYVIDGTDRRYRTAGQIAKRLGMVWGGDFIHPRPDPDHVQLGNDI